MQLSGLVISLEAIQCSSVLTPNTENQHQMQTSPTPQFKGMVPKSALDQPQIQSGSSILPAKWFQLVLADSEPRAFQDALPLPRIGQRVPCPLPVQSSHISLPAHPGFAHWRAAHRSLSRLKLRTLGLGQHPLHRGWAWPEPLCTVGVSVTNPHPDCLVNIHSGVNQEVYE